MTLPANDDLIRQLFECADTLFEVECDHADYPYRFCRTCAGSSYKRTPLGAALASFLRNERERMEAVAEHEMDDRP